MKLLKDFSGCSEVHSKPLLENESDPELDYCPATASTHELPDLQAKSTQMLPKLDTFYAFNISMTAWRLVTQDENFFGKDQKNMCKEPTGGQGGKTFSFYGRVAFQVT